jgi:RNA polymerase sigma-70 factor, ECF subfamily
VRVHRFDPRFVAAPALPEDIVREVFSRWQAGSFKLKSRVSTWIVAIARYKALSALRSRSDEPLERRRQSRIRRRIPFSYCR